MYAGCYMSETRKLKLLLEEGNNKTAGPLHLQDKPRRVKLKLQPRLARNAVGGRRRQRSAKFLYIFNT